MPHITRTLETSLYVADLDRSEAFYARLFGFTTMLRDARMCAMAVPNRHVLLLFQVGGSVVASPSEVGTIPGHDGRGTQHLCFGIPAEELGAWQAHIVAAGLPIESRLEWPKGGKSLYFRDPDGHSLEVATPGLWANDPA